MQNQISGEQKATTNTTVSSVGRPGQPETTPVPDVAKSLLADLIARSRLYHRSQDYQALLDFTSGLRTVQRLSAAHSAPCLCVFQQGTQP